METNMKPLKSKKPFMSFMVFTLVTPFMSFMPINYDLHKRCHYVPFMLEMCQPSYIERNHKRINDINEYRHFSLFYINGEEMMPIMDPNEHEVSTAALHHHQGNIKGGLTERELKFIQLHVVWNVPVKRALILSGYPNYSEQHAFVVGRKIVSKYECWAGGAEIFSDLNFGPVDIARSIIDIAVHCPNAQVRLNAIALAAKCTGMLREAIEAQPGVTIIIKGRDDQPAVPGGGSPAQPYQDKPKALAGPVAITR
jgi:hypothetical protein